MEGMAVFLDHSHRILSAQDPHVALVCRNAEHLIRKGTSLGCSVLLFTQLLQALPCTYPALGLGLRRAPTGFNCLSINLSSS